jgi:hypothetical protein
MPTMRAASTPSRSVIMSACNMKVLLPYSAKLKIIFNIEILQPGAWRVNAECHTMWRIAQSW